MIVEKCPYLFKVGSGDNCYRCSNKLNHIHECSFNNPMRDHTHHIGEQIYKYHVVVQQNAFQVFVWEDNHWKEVERELERE